jgi:hypothetical protein
MKLKPFAAFGYVLTRNTYTDGEVYTAVIGESVDCTTFWTKGAFKNYNLSTGADIHDFPTGYFLRPTDYVPGMFMHTVVGDAEVFCYDSRLNNGELPQIDPWFLTGGAQTVLPKGTKLFLCSGTLTVNDNNIDKPTQLHIQSGNLLVTSVTDCYGLIFS